MSPNKLLFLKKIKINLKRLKNKTKETALGTCVADLYRRPDISPDYLMAISDFIFYFNE